MSYWPYGLGSIFHSFYDIKYETYTCRSHCAEHNFSFVLLESITVYEILSEEVSISVEDLVTVFAVICF